MQLQIVFTNTEIHIPTSALGDILIRSEARVALPVRNMQVPTEQQRAICGMVFFVGAESGIETVKEQVLCFLHTFQYQLNAISLLSQHLVPVRGRFSLCWCSVICTAAEPLTDMPEFAEREQTLVLAAGLFKTKFHH